MDGEASAQLTLDTKHFRPLLVEERELTLRSCGFLDEELQGLQVPGAESQDEQIGGGGSFTFDREFDRALEANSRRLLEAIDAALRRIDEGTFGVCVRCGRPIPAERLEAVPHVAMCVSCEVVSPQ